MRQERLLQGNLGHSTCIFWYLPFCLWILKIIEEYKWEGARAIFVEHAYYSIWVSWIFIHWEICSVVKSDRDDEKNEAEEDTNDKAYYIS